MLLHIVEEETDVFMNLNPKYYMTKNQKIGQWKWRDNNSDSTQEMSSFLVAEISDNSHIWLLGDRFYQFFTRVGLSEGGMECGLRISMQNQKDDHRNKNKELSKLKLKLALNFPVYNVMCDTERLYY